MGNLRGPSRGEGDKRTTSDYWRAKAFASITKNLRGFPCMVRPKPVINTTVYNRSIYKYNLIDVYKYNHIDVFINAFLKSFGKRKF